MMSPQIAALIMASGPISATVEWANDWDRSMRVPAERVDLLDIAPEEDHRLIRRCQSEPGSYLTGHLCHVHREHVFMPIMDYIVPGDSSFHCVQIPDELAVPGPVRPLDETCGLGGQFPLPSREPENNQAV